jgi:very-short-patch-repair endonuclease/DNA polymerase III delta prime subunit
MQSSENFERVFYRFQPLPRFKRVLMSSGISQKLQGSRKELLDIGLRNTMLNFRASAKTLAVVDELSELVFHLLYRQGKAMSFAPMARQKLAALAKPLQIDGEDAQDAATDELLLQELDGSGESGFVDDELDESGRARRHTDARLQTALDEERLFLQLLRIHSEARAFIEEQGVNTLFLALGFLHWYEADNSETLRKAPLMLLPVTLERSGAKDAFKLRYSGDELMPNLSLIAKLKTDFGLDLTACEFSEDRFDATEGSLDSFYAEVTDLISKQSRWKVSTNEAALGFFSFGKFLMFKDLDPKSWPQDQQPDAHPVITRLLGSGFGDQRPAYAEDVNIDSVLQPGEVRFVKDADSSQTEAILEVREGANLVIQGPPGTGKSQTITNIIAELIAQKKTVLFVAEKMAALEVVKRRLDECHLGDAVLELHSHKSTKTSVLKELGRTLEQGRPLTKVGEDDLANLADLQGHLNRYCAAVSAPVGASGMGFVEVLGRYLKLKHSDGELPAIAFAPMASWTQADQLKHRELVEVLTLHLKEMGRADQNPFWGSKRTFFSPIEKDTASEALQQASAHLAALDAAVKALSTRLMLTQPATLADVVVICRGARRAAEAPRLHGVELSTGDWQLRREAIRELLGAGQRMSQCKAKHGARLIEAAWDQDLLEVRQNLLAYGDKWWKVFSGRYRASKARLQGLAQGVLPGSNAEQLGMVDSVLAYQQSRKVYDQHESLGSALFGAQWQRQQSDWAVLDRVSAWVVQLYEDLGNGHLPQGIIAFLAKHADVSGLGAAVSDIEAHLAGLDQALLAGLEVIGMQDNAQTLRNQDLSALGAHLQLWQASLSALYQMARFNVLADEMHQAQLGELLNIALSSETPDQLPAILDFSWYSGLVQKAYAEKPALQQFDRIKHEHQIARFKALDAASLNHAQTGLARQVWEQMPNVNQPGEMATLRAELNKKRRHIPIRQLIDKAGRAIQQIKPVFMMSPMSIANFLPPGKLAFDVVVFDEASQVKAVDAFGAILRGKQVVVVGDTRQMPPSDLFSRDIAPDDENDATADIESILSLFKAAGSQERYLRWHYRSRHESLIAVSNVEFYDSKLVVFPSAGQHLHAKGVSFDYLPHALYDRGRTRTNKEEAKAVAQAVMKHALETPELSLGVAAFSVPQRDLISVEVELLRRKTPQAEVFFTAQGSEPFFVKNLENIQGDERDVIFISIGYGRNESGRIAREFGPLNKDGGHRRLNVLITRAKLAMRVFCNFRGDELDIDVTAKHGVRALKNFLKYAETGELEVAKETGKAPDSPFEDQVIRALRDLDYQIEPQVGTAGYFIDLAVKDPEFPGRYVLAVECDGAAYHSSRSARDRDRLRQGVLEGLGWNFHRIWSTDWFRNPEQEISRTVAAIEAARERIANHRNVPVAETSIEPPHEILRDDTVDEVEPLASAPYEKARLAAVTNPLELHQHQPEQLLQLIRTVVDVESPVHSVEVTRRLMDAFGVTRQGSRITAAVEQAIGIGIKQRHFLRRGEFLHLADNRPVVIRSRAHWESSERKLEWVAPEELDRALIDIIISGFSMSHDDAISGALRLLGFGRATAKVTAVVEERIDQLISDRRLELREGRLVVCG